MAEILSDKLESAAAASDPLDAKIHLNVAGKSLVLLIEAKKAVYPRDVRQVLWQFKALHQPPYAHEQPDALIERLGQVLDAHQVGYAVSYEAAAQRYAPFLSGISQVRTRLLPSAGADAAIAQLDARVVSEGSNLAVNEVKSAGELLFRQQVGGAWLASPIQVCLDLLRGEGRAKVMAEHLRRERIGF